MQDYMERAHRALIDAYLTRQTLRPKGLLGIPGFYGVRITAVCGACHSEHPLEHVFEKPEEIRWVCHCCECRNFVTFTEEMFQETVAKARELATRDAFGL